MNAKDIVMGNTYEYACAGGEPLQVEVVHQKGEEFLCILPNGTQTLWGIADKLSPISTVSTPNDFKIDEPVRVRMKGDATWTRRHFAGWNSKGEPLTFYGGSTSWSAEGNTSRWDECRRPTEEELKLRGGEERRWVMKGGAA